MSNFTNFYSINIKIIKEWLSNFNQGSVIAIEIPEGLKNFTKDILSILGSIRSDINYIIVNESNFGSCLLHLDIVKETKASGLIHFGHNPYPFYFPQTIPVLYVEVMSVLKLDHKILEKVVQILVSKDLKNILIFSTQQHKTLAEELTKFLISRGFNVLNSSKEKVIFGCFYGEKYLRVKPDAAVIIAGGKFHALGVGLSFKDLQSIIHIDPYEQKVSEISQLIKKILQIRYYKMYRALDAKTWVLINGVEGQNRWDIVKEIIRLINEKKLKYVLVVSKYVNEQYLRNIDQETFDVYVIFSCPRIPIDDLQYFEKPVLTPGEAKMVLTSRLEKYIFPW